MEDQAQEVPQGPCHPLPTRTYKGADALLHNLPYIIMTVLGAIVLFQSFRGPASREPAGHQAACDTD